jgi:hypothetical protein
VVFTRGLETLDLGPFTQVQIHDRGTAAKPNTVVQQHFGTVSVEAQVENVQHVAVETPYLAAVVKGTRFTVTSGKTGAEVSVQRGHVEVDDHHNKSHTLIAVGQSATVDAITTGDDIAVSGTGKLSSVIGADGTPLTSGDKGKGHSGKSGNDTSPNTEGEGSSGNGNSGNGNSGKGGSNGNHSDKGKD